MAGQNDLLLLTMFPASQSPLVMQKPVRLRTLERIGSLRAWRTRSAHLTEYVRYVMPAARQYCTIADRLRLSFGLCVGVARGRVRAAVTKRLSVTLCRW